jgi:hypothetical protein
MRLVGITLAVGVSGCALVFDEDRYSANFDATRVDDTSASPEDTSIDSSAPIDTATDTFAEDLACPDGEQRCDGVCTDVSNTLAHCGACNNDCARHGPGVTCGGGVCRCPSDRCPATGSEFKCTAIVFDPLNCGACGKVCDKGEYCRNGACACMPGLTNCSPTGCVDINGHHDHCGSCTLDCSSTNNTCRASAPLDGYKCTLDQYGCPSGRTQCFGDHCFDLKNDETNCGTCGKVCARDEVCVAGACRGYYTQVGTCASGETECPPLPLNQGKICVAGTACPG